MLDLVYYNSSLRINTSNLNRLFSCLLPPSQDICSQICRLGFSDALRFLTKNGKILNFLKINFLALTPCAKCLRVQSNVIIRPNHSQRRDFYDKSRVVNQPAR